MDMRPWNIQQEVDHGGIGIPYPASG